MYQFACVPTGRIGRLMAVLKSIFFHIGGYLCFLGAYFLIVFCANWLSVQPGQGSLVKPGVPYFSAAAAGILGAGFGLWIVKRVFLGVKPRSIFWIHLAVVLLVQVIPLVGSLYYFAGVFNTAFLGFLYASESPTVFIHTLIALITSWRLTREHGFLGCD